MSQLTVTRTQSSVEQKIASQVEISIHKHAHPQKHEIYRELTWQHNYT